MTDAELDHLARRFDHPELYALALVGSHARGDAGTYSDVDLLRISAAGALPGRGSHLLMGRLVNVSDASLAELEAWFSDPQKAVQLMVGLRRAKPLLERGDTFSRLQIRASAFIWGAEMQAKADAWASAQLVGWAEEALKGLEGLRRDAGGASEIGRLLNARFGLSWGLAKTVQVQRGLLAESDNSFFADLESALGASRWFGLLRKAYGLNGEPLRAQVGAGLQLYTATAELLHGALQVDDRPVVAHTVRLIAQALRAR